MWTEELLPCEGAFLGSDQRYLDPNLIYKFTYKLYGFYSPNTSDILSSLKSYLQNFADILDVQRSFLGGSLNPFDEYIDVIMQPVVNDLKPEYFSGYAITALTQFTTITSATVVTYTSIGSSYSPAAQSVFTPVGSAVGDIIGGVVHGTSQGVFDTLTGFLKDNWPIIVIAGAVFIAIKKS